MGSGDISMISKAELLAEYNARLPKTVVPYATWQAVADAYILALQKDILRNMRMAAAKTAAEAEQIV